MYIGKLFFIVLIINSILFAELINSESTKNSDNEKSLEINKNKLNTKLYERFMSLSSNMQVLDIHKDSDNFVDDNSKPSLSIEKIISSDKNGTLIEFIGLPRYGAEFSAIIHKSSFRVLQSNGLSKVLKEIDGVEEKVDGKGETAIFVRPGDKFYALFENVDTYFPFSIDHLGRNKIRSTYFTNLDPRYIERYRDAYLQADTSEKLYNFIITYSANDPDNVMLPALRRLLEMWRVRNDFEGYYSAYLVAQLSSDAKLAQKLARTDEHKSKLENMAVVTLINKSRLFDFDLKVNKSNIEVSEGTGFFIKHNFRAYAKFNGKVFITLNTNSPIKLKYGTYKVVLESTVTYPRNYKRRSAWLGNEEHSNPEIIKKEISVIMSPNNYNHAVDVDFGTITVSFLQRGSSNGYEEIWSNGVDPKISLKIKRVEFIK